MLKLRINVLIEDYDIVLSFVQTNPNIIYIQLQLELAALETLPEECAKHTMAQ